MNTGEPGGMRRDELKINVESMVRCGGSCEGCILGRDERVGGSVWPRTMFDRARPFVSAFIRSHLETGVDFHEISVAFGQGDHFLLDPDVADDIVGWTAGLSPGRVVGFITASAIGRRERVARSADAWARAMHRHGQAFNVDLVLDPVKVGIERFAETYGANIGHIKSVFGDVDLNINVGPDTPAAATPSQIRSFVMENGFSRLTLNLVPVPGKGREFAREWDDISEWILGSLDLWRPGDGYYVNFYPTIAPLIEGARNGTLADGDFAQVLSFVEERLAREIYVDGDGAVSHTQAGFGDVPLGRRMGFHPSLNVDVAPEEVPGRIAASARRLGARMASTFLASPSCRECPFATVCPKIGAAALVGAMRPHLAGEGCPAGVRPLLERIESLAMRGADYGIDPSVHVPADFDEALLPHARRVRPFSGAISLKGFGVK